MMLAHAAEIKYAKQYPIAQMPVLNHGLRTLAPLYSRYSALVNI